MNATQNFTTEIHPKRGDYNDIHFLDGKKSTVGRGFIPKHGKRAGKIILIQCPVCREESYLMNFNTISCTDCGFDANE